MKVHTIEIAEAIEQELKKFVNDWGGGYPMKFMRFVDLGGKQTDLYAYTHEKGASPWMIIRIKSVMKTEMGECIQVFVNIAGKPEGMEEVLVSPEVWKLPALADRILNFSKSEMLLKIGEGSEQLGPVDSPSLGQGSSSNQETDTTEEEDDYEDLDTAGILAGDGDSADSDFNPEDLIAQANAAEDEPVADPSDLIRQLNEESESEEDDEEKD